MPEGKSNVTDKRISILFPVHNLGHMVSASVPRVLEALKSFKDVDLLFANDGSTDDSLERLHELTEHSGIRVFSHENRGLGYTLRRLINEAHGEICVYLDLDLSFDVTHLPNLIHQMESNEIAVASKYRGKASCDLPLTRRVCSRLYYLSAKLLCGISVLDVGSGMVVFRKDSIKDLDLRTDGFLFHTEFFHKAKQHGYRIIELPVPYVHEEGDFRVFRDGFRTAKHLFQYALKDSRLWSSMAHWKDLAERN